MESSGKVDTHTCKLLVIHRSLFFFFFFNFIYPPADGENRRAFSTINNRCVEGGEKVVNILACGTHPA